MSKFKLLGVAACALLLHSCDGNHHTKKSKDDDSFIVKDSANRMIQSYLTSIEPVDSTAEKKADLYSLSVDADDLRMYLNDKPSIKTVKLMFAHTLEYINKGNGGKPAGYKSGALTLVLAGYDRAGNYVYMDGNQVMDHCVPCPHNCNGEGSAASNLLQ